MARNNFRAMFERAWNQTSPDIKTEFGEEYFEYCETLLDVFDELTKTKRANSNTLIIHCIHTSIT